MIETLTVDDLTFEVRRSARRKTLELTVDRDGELLIAAPKHLAVHEMKSFVRDKRFWLYTKIAEKEALRRQVTTAEFVTGENFPYLGRNHRLLLVDEQHSPLALTGGRFRLLRSEAVNGRRHFVRWYSDHALPWIQKRVAHWAPALKVEPTGVRTLDLGFRWGSCGKTGTLNFHWAAILLPPTVVEYVVVHELVHLLEPNHTRAFWDRLELALPDYERRKAWLAEHGGGHVIL